MTKKTHKLPKEAPKTQAPPEDRFWAKRVLDERGIKILPPDHWIYREGATISFVRSRPREEG